LINFKKSLNDRSSGRKYVGSSALLESPFDLKLFVEKIFDILFYLGIFVPSNI